MNARLCWLAGLTVALLAGAVDARAGEADRKVVFDIGAQSMLGALVKFSEQSGIQVAFPTEDAKGIQAPAVTGELTPIAALERLLQGSGLRYEVMNKGRIVTIRTITDSKNKPAGNKPNAGMLPGDVDLSLYGLENGKYIQMADAAADVNLEKAGTAKGVSGVEEMIVKEDRIKPFGDANVDIPRTINDVQPYYIFDSETIERSAAMNVEDFLKQRLTMNASAQTPSQNTNAPGTGELGGYGNASYINLRGLGGDKTLVLVNGRRVAGPFGSAQLFNGGNPSQADLNGIPLSAIERIEVLPSSASGIYGGSAIGGVINVILKRNYSGGEVRVGYDNTMDTDSPTRKAGISYGTSFHGGKTRVTFSGQWTDGEPLQLQDRRELIDRGVANILRNNRAFLYSDSNPFLGVLPNITSASTFTFTPTFQSFPDPGTLTLKNGTPLGSRYTYIPVGTSSATAGTTLNSGLLANAGGWNLDLPATAQNPTGLYRRFSVTPNIQSFMASIRREFGSAFEMSLDWSRSDNDAYTPTAIGPTSVQVLASNPNNPFNSGVRVTFPNSRTGKYTMGWLSESATLGFIARLPQGWIAQADYTWSRTSGGSGFPSFDTSAFDAAVNSGTLNPFVDQQLNPIDLSPYITHAQYYITSTLRSIAVRSSGPLPELPWGQPNLTVGMEHRSIYAPQNTATFTYAINTADNSLRIAFPREQAASSLYMETLIPLIKRDWLPLVRSLELQASGRSERYLVDSGTSSVLVNLASGSYSYTGPTLNGAPFFAKSTYTSNNSTIGIKYRPLADVTLRASTASAFLPPTPAQLIKNPLPDTYQSTVLDPRNNNSQVMINTISGGNPDLSPQGSRSVNAGIIWEPSWKALQGLRFNAEYYNIEQKNAIGSLSAQLLLDNESAYPGRVVRNAAGVVTFIDVSSVNLYKRETAGWDLNATYGFKTGIGNFNLQVAESIIVSLKEQYSLTLPAYDSVNFPSEGGAAKYKSNLNLAWEHRNWSAGWSARYFSSYKQSGAAGGPSSIRSYGGATGGTSVLTQGSMSIPAQMYHDLFLGYSFAKGRGGHGGIVSAFTSDFFSGMTLQLGVKNVFDKLPPYDVRYSYYISPYGDTRLRSCWLSAKKSF